ncbi:unnamed protein product [Symbiodinium natans]|uniref:Uncharacterized protein n=1 Tax=Symbiodinium natans TaxID=878477 RepID=A0A812KUE7_9DINO|nr:unnamed protein product [Symbiodinium natans]
MSRASALCFGLLVAVGEAVLFAKMEKYRQDDCTGTMYDIDLDASGECLPANNERYICNATGVLYEKFNSSGSNSDCSNALEWGDFYPFNSCSQGYRYLDCVDLPAVTLETFTDTTCTTKEGESIQPIVDCTLIDGAWIKSEYEGGNFTYSAHNSSDCTGDALMSTTIPCGSICTPAMGVSAKNLNACPTTSTTQSTTTTTTTTTTTGTNGTATTSAATTSAATGILGLSCFTASVLVVVGLL